MKQERQKNQRFTVVTTKRGCPDVIVHRGRDRDSCLKIAQSYATGVGEQKGYCLQLRGQGLLSVGSTQGKTYRYVTAREFEYVGGMAAMERRDEERRKADKDALWR
jgi:hypothetical protein